MAVVVAVVVVAVVAVVVLAVEVLVAPWLQICHIHHNQPLTPPPVDCPLD